MVENCREHNEIDKQIIAYIQADLPLESRPFLPLAQKLGISEEEIIIRINNLKNQSYMRRFGAILRHQKAGYDSNAMVAWLVTITEADRIGKIMAGFNEVSHCYLRDTPPEFGYNLFTMIHACSEMELQNIIERLVKASGLSKYTIIRSLHEYKKVSMIYY